MRGRKAGKVGMGERVEKERKKKNMTGRDGTRGTGKKKGRERERERETDRN